jgi:hypothetical protein
MIRYHWYVTVTCSTKLRDGIHAQSIDKFPQINTCYGRIDFSFLPHRFVCMYVCVCVYVCMCVWMYVCPPAHMNQFDSHGRIYMKFNLYFSKLCSENSSSIKIWQKRTLYMKTNIHLWSYIAHLYLEREMFQVTLQGKSKHITLRSIIFSS